MPRIPIKVSVAFDTRRKKYCAAKIRVLPAHDIRDVKPLLKNCSPKVLVADKAYDANWLHEYCRDNNIKAHIPLRKSGKPRHKNMSARMLAAKKYRNKTYHRRELAESGNSSIRKYGTSVSSKKARTIRTEIYGRLTCHNIFSYFTRLLG
jgi:transposase